MKVGYPPIAIKFTDHLTYYEVFLQNLFAGYRSE